MFANKFLLSIYRKLLTETIHSGSVSIMLGFTYIWIQQDSGINQSKVTDNWVPNNEDLMKKYKIRLYVKNLLR